MMFRRLIPLLNWLALATLIGALAGVTGALLIALENSYFQESMRGLAGRVLEAGALRGTYLGFLSAAGGLLVFAFVWPIGRWLFSSARIATVGAATAVPGFALLLIAAYRLNLEVFPSFLSATSLFGNTVLIVVAFLSWWLLVKWLARRQDRLRSFAGDRNATAALLGSIVLVLGLPVVLARLWSVEVDARKPSVLIVLIDALRADRLGSYGYHRDTTPNIDEVARQGWRFDAAIAQASWTKPSVASLITGLYVRQTSIGSGAWAQQNEKGTVLVEALAAEHSTLAEHLASMGYETGAFGTNHHLLPELGFSQGYLTYDWDQPVRIGVLQNFIDRFRPEFAADWINDHFIDWVDANEGARFFAYLHHIDVHWPYRSPAPFAGMYAEGRPAEDFNRPRFMPDAVERLKQGGSSALNPETLRAMSDAYDEGIRHVDDRLGTLFEKLKDRGQYDNTLIIITSDHGEEFMEHGLLGHAESLYDEVIRVPLIVKFPCPGPDCAPRTVMSQVELVDIFPTVMHVVGAEPPDHVVGRRLSEPASESRIVYSELASSVALRTPRWKWIYNEQDDSGELFDLKADPREANDLATNEPVVRELLSSRVLDFAATRQRSTTAGAEVIEADEKMLENLKALGYVQ